MGLVGGATCWPYPFGLWRIGLVRAGIRVLYFVALITTFFMCSLSFIRLVTCRPLLATCISFLASSFSSGSFVGYYSLSQLIYAGD